MDILTFKAGDIISYSGTVYTARDAAHARIVASLSRGEEPPFPLQGAAIYYAGPTPTKPGEIFGSCGPTSSTRMDDYTPTLLAHGLEIMIGKGNRSAAVIDAMKQYGAVYLCAVGGAGALFTKHVRSCADVAYPDLGCEAVRRLEVSDFPLLVGIDAQGNSVLK